MSVHIDKVSGSSCCDFGGIDNGLSFDGCYQPMHSSYHQSRSSFAQTDVIFLDSSLRKLVTLIEDRCINNPDKEFSAVVGVSSSFSSLAEDIFCLFFFEIIFSLFVLELSSYSTSSPPISPPLELL